MVDTSKTFSSLVLENYDKETNLWLLPTKNRKYIPILLFCESDSTLSSVIFVKATSTTFSSIFTHAAKILSVPKSNLKVSTTPKNGFASLSVAVGVGTHKVLSQQCVWIGLK
jgi:hypothetical protein